MHVRVVFAVTHVCAEEIAIYKLSIEVSTQLFSRNTGISCMKCGYLDCRVFARVLTIFMVLCRNIGISRRFEIREI